MAVSSPLSSRQTVAALLTLTAVTGLVDAASYLRLGRVFVANMTGNVVFLGFTVDPHSGLSATASVIAIAGFVLGALAGGRAAHALAAARPDHWLATAFTGEALILGLVAVLTATSVLPWAGTGRLGTIAILAAALGVQNSTVRRLGAADLKIPNATGIVTSTASHSIPLTTVPMTSAMLPATASPRCATILSRLLPPNEATTRLANPPNAANRAICRLPKPS